MSTNSTRFFSRNKRYFFSQTDCGIVVLPLFRNSIKIKNDGFKALISFKLVVDVVYCPKICPPLKRRVNRKADIIVTNKSKISYDRSWENLFTFLIWKNVVTLNGDCRQLDYGCCLLWFQRRTAGGTKKVVLEIRTRIKKITIGLWRLKSYFPSPKYRRNLIFFRLYKRTVVFYDGGEYTTFARPQSIIYIFFPRKKSRAETRFVGGK